MNEEDFCCEGQREHLIFTEMLRKHLERILLNDFEFLEKYGRGDREIYLTNSTYTESVILYDSVSLN